VSDQPDETTQASEAEPSSQPPADASENEATPGWIARLGVVGFVRVAIGLLGVSGFVVGIIVAWDATSATTLLVVSGILVLFAALGLDWSEIRGTGPGGWTVQLLRRVEDRIEEVAAGEGVPPAIREELEALRAEVKALTPSVRSRASRQTDWRRSYELARELAKPRATHSFDRPDAVTLKLRVPHRDTTYRCIVRTPTDNAYTAATRRPIIGSMVDTYSLTYPDEFERSEPLVPGRYEVEWRPAALLEERSSATPLLAALKQNLTPPIATDSFTIPEGVVSGWQREASRTPEMPEPASADNPPEKKESSDQPS